MVTVRILKRKDAASVAVAVAIGWILVQFVQIISSNWATRIANMGRQSGMYGIGAGPGSSWRDEYLAPVLTLILGLIVLEVVLWVAVTLRASLVRRK
jgi:hypothetical protein